MMLIVMPSDGQVFSRKIITRSQVASTIARFDVQRFAWVQQPWLMIVGGKFPTWPSASHANRP
ncbi:MAG: hypothetical protein AAGA21_13420 [Pseudomonadota bacterium]